MPRLCVRSTGTCPLSKAFKDYPKMPHTVDSFTIREGEMNFGRQPLSDVAGIYVGGDRVVHFMANLLLVPSNRPRCKNCGYDLRAQLAAAVVKTCLDCFLKGDRLFRFEYEVNVLYYMLKDPGSCTTNKCDPADVVINRAHNACIKGFGKYNLVENNCESFALYCKTGTRISHQVLGKLVKLVVMM